jgi:hypothetical protein
MWDSGSVYMIVPVPWHHHEGREVILCASLTFAVDVGEWLALCPHRKEHPVLIIDRRVSGSQSHSDGEERNPALAVNLTIVCL